MKTWKAAFEIAAMTCALLAWSAPASAQHLVWSTYLGGSGVDELLAVTTDSNGNVYVLGSTTSADFPTTAGAFMRTLKGPSDAVVVKLRGDGTGLLWSTYLGGTGDESGRAIAVDAAGNVYVTGNTGSTDFPVTTGAHRVAFAGGVADGFVVKLAAGGDRLLWSTYLGGDWDDYPRALALDGSGNVVVAGSTNSLDFPVTPGVVMPVRTPGIVDGADGFITKLAATGSTLVWSTYFGSSGGTDNIFGLALDALGRPTVVGWTLSPSFPVTAGAYDQTFDYRREGYVTRLDPTARSYVYSTFIGGFGHDQCRAVALDPTGAAAITGSTESADFPTTAGAAQRALGGGSDAFAFLLSATGSTLLYSTYLGGAGADEGSEVAIAGGITAITGSTESSDYPVSGGSFDGSANGGSDAWFTSLAASGGLGSSTYLGAGADDHGSAVAVAGLGFVVAGATNSSTFPTSVGAWDRTFGGGATTDGFVGRFDLAPGGVGVGDGPALPRIGLAPVEPNPHTDRATIRFALAAPGRARLVICDLQGRNVRVLADESLASGTHTRTWDGRDQSGNAAPAGMYLVALYADGRVETRRIARLR